MKFGTNYCEGTGCLIGPRTVLTCALYDRQQEMEATEVLFYPAINENQGESFQAKQFFFPPQYKTEGVERDNYDIGVL